MGTFLQRWRLPLLCTLLLLSVAYNLVLGHMAPPVDTDVSAFIVLWLLAFLPYLAACLLILCTRASSGYRQWVELLVVLGGALLLRGILLPIEPDLSHDSWRYLWDARVTLHGYSPYVYAPGDPQLLPLRDDFLYGIIRFRNVPTLYPPVAQGFYLLSYLLAPANLVVFKVLLTICEIVSCCALAWLLKKRGSDPARCVIYAWAPLPIIEFAIQGHIDALTIMLMLLTVVCAQSTRRGSRVLTGVLLALAALTKIYPVLLLAVFLRKRDWALLASCITTILLAYVPYIVLGHGQILGFFATYASERTSNAGIIMQVINWLAMTMHLDIVLTMILIYVLDLALVGSAALIVLRLRQGERISVEAGILVLIGAIFAAASHIFPWYTAALLPWVALYTHQQSAHKGQYQSNEAIQGAHKGQYQSNKPYRTGVRPYRAPTRDAPTMVRTRIIGRARTIVGASLVGALEWYCPACLAVCTAWYFSSASILGYLFDGKVDWSLYYLLAYDLSLLALGLAFQSRTGRKRTLASFCLPRGKVYTSNTNESNRNA
ncbi:MAG: DUF2029 domain-containing protein [Chloroflexi bacterium]|nr:MAG: DUF2029 domain-containing protein [Chloroflexota bacterium]